MAFMKRLQKAALRLFSTSADDDEQCDPVELFEVETDRVYFLRLRAGYQVSGNTVVSSPTVSPSSSLTVPIPSNVPSAKHIQSSRTRATERATFKQHAVPGKQTRQSSPQLQLGVPEQALHEVLLPLIDSHRDRLMCFDFSGFEDTLETVLGDSGTVVRLCNLETQTGLDSLKSLTAFAAMATQFLGGHRSHVIIVAFCEEAPFHPRINYGLLVCTAYFYFTGKLGLFEVEEAFRAVCDATGLAPSRRRRNAHASLLKRFKLLFTIPEFPNPQRLDLCRITLTFFDNSSTSSSTSISSRADRRQHRFPGNVDPESLMVVIENNDKPVYCLRGAMITRRAVQLRQDARRERSQQQSRHASSLSSPLPLSSGRHRHEHDEGDERLPAEAAAVDTIAGYGRWDVPSTAESEKSRHDLDLVLPAGLVSLLGDCTVAVYRFFPAPSSERVVLHSASSSPSMTTYTKNQHLGRETDNTDTQRTRASDASSPSTLHSMNANVIAGVMSRSTTDDDEDEFRWHSSSSPCHNKNHVRHTHSTTTMAELMQAATAKEGEGGGSCTGAPTVSTAPPAVDTDVETVRETSVLDEVSRPRHRPPENMQLVKTLLFRAVFSTLFVPALKYKLHRNDMDYEQPLKNSSVEQTHNHHPPGVRSDGNVVLSNSTPGLGSEHAYDEGDARPSNNTTVKVHRRHQSSSSHSSHHSQSGYSSSADAPNSTAESTAGCAGADDDIDVECLEAEAISVNAAVNKQSESLSRSSSNIVPLSHHRRSRASADRSLQLVEREKSLNGQEGDDDEIGGSASTTSWRNLKTGVCGIKRRFVAATYHLDDESGKGWESDEGEAGKESFFELYRCCCCIQATNPLKCKCVGFSIIIFPTQVTAYLS